MKRKQTDGLGTQHATPDRIRPRIPAIACRRLNLLGSIVHNQFVPPAPESNALAHLGLTQISLLTVAKASRATSSICRAVECIGRSRHGRKLVTARLSHHCVRGYPRSR